MSARVAALVAKGAVQISRKYRRVFVPPPEGCVDWLRKNAPERYDTLLAAALQCHHDRGCHEELTQEEFVEFYQRVNGRTIWVPPPDREPCEFCESLGHMHRRDCPNGKGKETP